MKYKVVTSVALALLVAGCGVNNASDNNANDNNGRKNVGLNTSRTDGVNRTRNVNDVNNVNNVNNGNNPPNVTNVGYTNFNDNNFRLSDDIANRVAGLKEVKSATVVLTDNHAYVAAVLNNGDHISTRVENKIADTVRSVDKSVDQVYVSTNPNFVDRVRRYANDVGRGRPVAGFGKEFGELVNRVFPNAR